MTDGALSSLKVLEYGDFISAAYCTKLMADLGADDIKIEPPVEGDRSRRHGPGRGGTATNRRANHGLPV